MASLCVFDDHGIMAALRVSFAVRRSLFTTRRIMLFGCETVKDGTETRTRTAASTDTTTQPSPGPCLFPSSFSSIILPLPPLLLVKQIRPRTAQIHNLGTAVAILLEPGALGTVEGVADALAAADDAFIGVVAETAFVADAGQSGGADVAVADGAFAVAFVAEARERDAGGFAAGQEVGVVARHGWLG